MRRNSPKPGRKDDPALAHRAGFVDPALGSYRAYGTWRFALRASNEGRAIIRGPLWQHAIAPPT